MDLYAMSQDVKYFFHARLHRADVPTGMLGETGNSRAAGERCANGNWGTVLRYSMKCALLACAIGLFVPRFANADAPSGASGTEIEGPTPTVATSGDVDAPIAPLSAEVRHALPTDGQVFEFVDGDTLKSALTRWCHSAGWTLVWRLDVDYPIRSADRLAGPIGFEAAVEQTLQAYWLQSVDLKASLYTRNRRLVISRLADRRH